VSGCATCGEPVPAVVATRPRRYCDIHSTQARSARDAAVRFRPGVGWEARCGGCQKRKRRRFWPLSHEFWDVRRGMQRCRTCIREDDAIRMRRLYHGSDEYREERKQRHLSQYQALSKHERTLFNRKRYDAHRARMAEAGPEEIRRQRELNNAAQRRYRARKKEAARG
jgi:hypothetical protein